MQAHHEVLHLAVRHPHAVGEDVFSRMQDLEPEKVLEAFEQRQRQIVEIAATAVATGIY